MTFTPISSGRGRVDRLPIVDPSDPRVPRWAAERYGNRRCTFWAEDDTGAEGSVVRGGRAPYDHPDGQDYRYGRFPDRRGRP